MLLNYYKHREIALYKSHEKKEIEGINMKSSTKLFSKKKTKKRIGQITLFLLFVLLDNDIITTTVNARLESLQLVCIIFLVFCFQVQLYQFEANKRERDREERRDADFCCFSYSYYYY